jgi:hypothetical protein
MKDDIYFSNFEADNRTTALTHDQLTSDDN